MRREPQARGPTSREARTPSPLRRAVTLVLGGERRRVAALLAVHLSLIVWGAARNSVTFDENYHLPAGVMIVARGDFGISTVNPPLVKALCAIPVLAAGARVPDAVSDSTAHQSVVGESFMRRNAEHYHRIFFAGRIVVALISVGLGILVWRFARGIYGARGGLLALAFYAFSAEALAHGGLVTMDLATGFAILSSTYAFWIFARTGRWGAFAWAALAVGAAALTRFTCVLLAPILATLALWGTWGRRFKRPLRVWLGLALLLPTTLAILGLGYLGQVSFRPLAEQQFRSEAFQALQTRAGWLRLPLPDRYVEGLDIQAHEGQGHNPWFLLGRIRNDRAWYYYPLALIFKWPLGFLGALAARAGLALRRQGRSRHDAFLLVPAVFVLAGAMFALRLNVGIRYVFALVPLLCVWLGGLAYGLRSSWPRQRARWRRWAAIGVALAVFQAAEVAAAAPWYLSFFNWPSGGPGGGYRLLNDSNVDWGQGLIALREELRRRGIERVHLTYFGTTDPAIYGIDYVPCCEGVPGPESDWIAVSSFYFVGMWQRMMTTRGLTEPVSVNMRILWDTPPVATPARCMFLFRIPR